ncbi:MAG: Fic family protein [Candidatus Woesearchaeota archaeon]
MAYIYKKTINNKSYYYLRISKTIKDKTIVKDIAYLGNDPKQIEPKLEKLSSIYKNEIKKSYKNINKFIQGEYYLKKIKGKKLKKDPYFDKEILEQIEAIKLHYNNHFLKQNQITIKEVYKQFLIDFAYNTTSLEGNTITLQEVNKLLSENLTPKNRTLREIYDLKNTEKVFFNLLDKRNAINHELIKEIHKNLIENIDNRTDYRTFDLHVFKSKFKSSPFQYIKTDIDLLLKLYKKYEKRLHPLVLAAIFHHKFEEIHPFADGNGRTGRILMNYILIKNSYPPIIIKKIKRGKYLDSLGKADKSGLGKIDSNSYKELVSYLSSEMLDSYWNLFNI